MCSPRRRRWMWLFTIRLHFETTKVGVLIYPRPAVERYCKGSDWLRWYKILSENFERVGRFSLPESGRNMFINPVWTKWISKFMANIHQESGNHGLPPSLSKTPKPIRFLKRTRGSLKGTKSLESYWESIWNAQWDKVPNENCAKGCEFDAKMTIYHSWLRQDRVQRGVLPSSIIWAVKITL